MIYLRIINNRRNRSCLVFLHSIAIIDSTASYIISIRKINIPKCTCRCVFGQCHLRGLRQIGIARIVSSKGKLIRSTLWPFTSLSKCLGHAKGCLISFDNACEISPMCFCIVYNIFAYSGTIERFSKGNVCIRSNDCACHYSCLNFFTS